MNNFDKIENVYFLGIGGIGMSALARYFNAAGKRVFGYDLTRSSLCERLEKEGMLISYVDDVASVPAQCMAETKTMVVFTPAVPKDNKIFQYFAGHKYFMLKRARVLGMISDNYKTVAVSGTHGKTTVSSVISNILKTSGNDAFAFLGGISKNLDSNLMLPENQQSYSDSQTLLVAEADEFDRSFLWIKPYVSVVTYLDADHLDIYKDRNDIIETFNTFVSQGMKDGYVVVNKLIEDLIDTKGIQKYTYSVCDTSADFYAENVVLTNGIFTCNIHTPQGVIENVEVGARGRVNVENSVACAAAAFCLGISFQNIADGISSFRGVKRRMDFHVHNDDFVYIDDYAHHPRELSATISSIRELFPDKKLTGIFQPHLYSRTRDFASEFAHSLDLLDNVILKEIYPAREKPIPGVTSSLVAGLMKNKNSIIINDDKKILEFLSENKPEVLLTLGAGNVDKLIGPITNLFKD